MAKQGFLAHSKQLTHMFSLISSLHQGKFFFKDRPEMIFGKDSPFFATKAAAFLDQRDMTVVTPIRQIRTSVAIAQEILIIQLYSSLA